MEVLQLLSTQDLKCLQERFECGYAPGGLDEDEFVDVFTEVLTCKAAGRPYLFGEAGANAAADTDDADPQQVAAAKQSNSDLLLRWPAEELQTLFREVDFNGDLSVSFEEFTSFAIASAVHANQSAAAEKPFKEYVQDRMPFRGQSYHVRTLIVLANCDRVVVSGFTRTTAHDANTGRCLHVFPNVGAILDLVYVVSLGQYWAGTDQNQLSIVEEAPTGSPANTPATVKHQLPCDRAVTHMCAVPFRSRLLMADRDGTLRTIALDNFRLAVMRQNLSIATLTHKMWRRFPEGVADMKPLPRDAVGNPSAFLIAASESHEVHIFDAEESVMLRTLPSGLKSPIRCLSYSDTQRLILASGNDQHFTAFSIDQQQQYPYELRDALQPHAHAIISVHALAGTHRVISADHAGVIKHWDMRQLSCADTFAVPRTAENQINTVMAFRYDDAHQRIYALGKEAVAFQYDRRVTAVFAHDDPLVAVMYVPQSRSVLSITGTQFRHWELGGGTAVATRKDLAIGRGAKSNAPAFEVTCAAVDATTGRQVIFGTADGCIGAMLVSTGRTLWKRNVTKNRVTFAFVVARGAYAYGTSSGNITLAIDSGDDGMSFAPLGPAVRAGGVAMGTLACSAGLVACTSSTHRRSLYVVNPLRRTVATLIDGNANSRAAEITAIAWVLDAGMPAGVSSATRPGTAASAAGASSIRGLSPPGTATETLSVLAVADTSSRVSLWTVGSQVHHLAARVCLTSLRMPRRSLAAALAVADGRHILAGTDAGAVAIFDVGDVLRCAVAPWEPSWTGAQLTEAAANATRPLRRTFNARGIESVASFTVLQGTDCFVLGTMNDDPILALWHMSGTGLGALCRGRGTAAPEDLGAYRNYSFDLSLYERAHAERFGQCGTSLGDILYAAAGAADPVEKPKVQEEKSKEATPPKEASATGAMLTETINKLQRSSSMRMVATAKERDAGVQERRRRKYYRHSRKHAHDRDLLRIPELEAAQPEFLQELVASDPDVRRHQGVPTPTPMDHTAPNTASPPGGAPLAGPFSLGGVAGEMTAATVLAPAAAGGVASPPTASPRNRPGREGILKERRDVASALLGEIQAQSTRGVQNRGDFVAGFGTVRVARGGPGSPPAVAPPAADIVPTFSFSPPRTRDDSRLPGRTGAAGSPPSPPARDPGPQQEFTFTFEGSPDDGNLDGDDDEIEFRPRYVRSRRQSGIIQGESRRGSFASTGADSALGKTTQSEDEDMLQGTRRAFQRLDGATPLPTSTFFESEVNKRAKDIYNNDESNAPTLPPVAPTKKHHGARLRGHGTLVIPEKIALPKVPIIEKKDRGWQLLITAQTAAETVAVRRKQSPTLSPKRRASVRLDGTETSSKRDSPVSARGEVSVRVGEDRLMMQYLAEVERAKAKRVAWEARRKGSPPVSVHRAGMTAALLSGSSDGANQLRGMKSVRLDRGQERRTFEGPSGELGFTSKGWKHHVVDPTIHAKSARF